MTVKELKDTLVGELVDDGQIVIGFGKDEFAPLDRDELVLELIDLCKLYIKYELDALGKVAPDA